MKGDSSMKCNSSMVGIRGPAGRTAMFFKKIQKVARPKAERLDKMELEMKL